MLLDLDSTRGSESGVPAEWRAYVEPVDAGFVIRGDKTAAIDLFLTVNGGAVISDRIEDVLDQMRAKGMTTQLSPFALAALLQSGLIPPPYSEFNDVYALTTGDIVNLSWQSGRPHVDFETDYPWFADRSRGDTVANTRTLLDLLTQATTRDLEAIDDGGFLMLSSGKDSMALALTLAESGRSDVLCVTYSTGDDDPEPAVAADVCRRLGLQHHTVTTPSDPDTVAAQLITFFERTPRPGTDLKQIPYVLATAPFEATGRTVLDGGGNDSFMGFLPQGRSGRKTHLRLRNRSLIDFVQRHTPVDSPINYIARSRFETLLPGRLLRFHEISTFLHGAVDPRGFWNTLSRDTAEISTLDLFALVNRYFTPTASMKKHRLAAHAIAHEASMPWCDHEVADYYFNLPEQDRYDTKHGINKVLLRRMLLEFLDYDASRIGKHYFAFDGARFVSENRDFIKAEIGACALWDQTKLGLIHEWIDAIDGRPLLHHSILTLFMVSGWHNHSRFAENTCASPITISNM
jgi:asparagine synthase (glutamine-hydrolysing)